MKSCSAWLFLLSVVASSLSADTWSVTSVADGGVGTLRDALTVAIDGDLVAFDEALSGTISLQTSLPDLTQSIIILGPSSGAVTIDGNSAYSIFGVNAPSIAISNLQFNNGTGTGGALYIHAGNTVSLDQVTITSCLGGGCSTPIFVETDGVFNIRNVAFQGSPDATVSLAVGSSLVIDSPMDFQVNVSGGGNITKMGSSRANLSSASLADISFVIAEGTVNFNGAISQSVIVTPGGTWTGSNSSLYIANNGVVRPTYLISTTSDYFQNSTGSLELPIAPDSNTPYLQVGGNATLGGTLTLLPQFGAYFKNRTYTLITTGGVVNQEFDATVSLRQGVVFELHYLPQSVEIEIMKNVLSMDGDVFDGNAGVIQDILENVDVVPGSDLETVIMALNALDPPSPLEVALINLSGASLTTLGWANAATMHQIVSQLSSQRLTFCGRDCGVSKPQCCNSKENNGFWAAAIGERTTQKLIDELEAFRSLSAGALVGYDRKIGSDYTAGLSTGYTHSHLKVVDNHSTIGTDGYHASTYHAFCLGRVSVDASFLSSFYHYHSDRHIPSLDRTAKSHFGGLGLLGHLGVNVPFVVQAVKKITWTPFAGADYIYIHQKSLKEHGAESVNLRVKSRDPRFIRSELGMQARGLFCKEWGTIVPSLSLSWVYFAPLAGTSLTARFENIPQNFKVHSTHHAFNEVAPAASLGFIIKENGWISLSYSGEFSHRRTDQQLNLTGRIQF